MSISPLFSNKNMLILIFISVGVILISYWVIILELINQWNLRPEYSHSFILILISIYIVWKLRYKLINNSGDPSWAGLLLISLSIIMLAVGRISYGVIAQYGLVLTIIGFIVTIFGFNGLKVIWAPVVLLLFTIPLPDWLYADISAKLQLISSRIGVGIIRLFNISVLQEGNIIDLGNYKLQVVEACDGLRYLFPLTSLSFLCAYMFKGKLWMRLIIFLSSVPIAIIMNGLRVGITGVLVEYYGIAAAEGFFHDFEGWIIFLGCTALLILEVYLFVKLSGMGSVSNALDIDFTEVDQTHETAWHGRLSSHFITSAIALFCAGILLSPMMIPQYKNYLPVENIPEHPALSAISLEPGDWRGEHSLLRDFELTILDPLDHIVTNYRNKDGAVINLYVAYWDEDIRGKRPHSPQICIPGGGWKLETINSIKVDEMMLNGESLNANRMEIIRGENRQLVYYWYQQRGRLIRTENSLRLYRYIDKLMKQRTDGAIVRLITALSENEQWEDADQRLKNFISLISDDLKTSIPN